MSAPQVIRELKRDELGRVELLDGPRGRLVRRVACGGRWPGTGWLARRLAARERRSLAALADLDGVAALVVDEESARAPGLDGRVPRAAEVVLRSWIEGVPLHEAVELPENFFDLLDDLAAALHARGVCHNDLHKEQNVLVDRDGYPGLVDFQLASVHARRGRRFEKRAAEDLRHLQKHRRRYTRDGRGPAGAARGAGHGLERGRLALVWRRLGKPVYDLVVHGIARKGASEPRRASHDPFPRWTAPLPARSGARERP